MKNVEVLTVIAVVLTVPQADLENAERLKVTALLRASVVVKKNGQFIPVSLASGIRVRPGKSRNPHRGEWSLGIISRTWDRHLSPSSFLSTILQPHRGRGNIDSAFPHVPPGKLIPLTTQTCPESIHKFFWW